MKPKYTPGPWGLWGGHSMHVSNGETAIAKILSTVANLGPKTRAEAKANARLISAAPELVEHLKWALDRIDPMNRGEYWERAKACVAKAEGEE